MKTIKLLFAAAVAVMMTGGARAGTATGVFVNGVSVGDKTSGAGWELSDSGNTIWLNESGRTYTIKGTDTQKRLGVHVNAKSCTVIAENLVLAPSGGCAFLLDDDISELDCTLKFKGICSFRSIETYAGIEVPSNAKLTICNDGTANLTAYGGKYGAGIGGAYSRRACGEIVINCNAYGTITAYGNLGAGIGGGMKYSTEWSDKTTKESIYRGGDCNKPIIINGGNITAYGSGGSAGIGGGGGTHWEGYFDHLGGCYADIQINGGRVSAYGSTGEGLGKYVGTGVGIGSGSNANSGPESGCALGIYGGTVYADSPDNCAIGSSANSAYMYDVLINGGSVTGRSGFRLTSGTCGRHVAGESALRVMGVKFGEFTPNAKVEADGLYKLVDGFEQSFAYGLNDLYADGNGEICLYLPCGKCFLWAYDRRYSVEVYVVGKTTLYSTTVTAEVYVTYDANGGHNSNGFEKWSALKQYKSAFGDLPTPVYPGYSFVGWRMANGNMLTEKTIVDGPMSLTAVWKADPRPKAVLEGSALRFVYDNAQTYGSKGSGWFPVDESADTRPSWYECHKFVNKVVFESSFKKYKPTSCASWFEDMEFLSQVQGLEYLDVSEVVNMVYMFRECKILKELDLRSFKTAKVTNMVGMFYCCHLLKRIYASELFTTSNVTTSANMFDACSELKGSSSTRYQEGNPRDATYARIDGGITSPGYFTYIGTTPYSVTFAADGGTGTMINQRCARDKVYQLDKCAFTKSGKTFKGWTCSNGKRYDDQMLIFNLAAEGEAVTMTAIWE